MIRNAKKGEFVYIRAEFRSIGDTGCAWVWVRNPDNYSFQCVPVPQSQIVCREPEALFVDGDGVARDIEAAPIAEKAIWK